ncbi:unnamed protein product [Ixodes pacificus]
MILESKLELSSVVWNSIGRLLERYNCSTLSARRRDRDLIFLFKCLHGVIDCPDLTSSINIHVPRRFLRISLPF